MTVDDLAKEFVLTHGAAYQKASTMLTPTFVATFFETLQPTNGRRLNKKNYNEIKKCFDPIISETLRNAIEKYMAIDKEKTRKAKSCVTVNNTSAGAFFSVGHFSRGAAINDAQRPERLEAEYLTTHS